MKVLSFVIPSYNSEPYLEKCLSSLLVEEVLDKLDIIIVNDGSTDGTVDIANKYCSMFPESVRLISQENKGHGGALNTGCASAVGKYTKPIDADDWIQSASLPDYIRFLEQCDSDVVLTHYHTVDVSSGEVKSWRSYPATFGSAITFDEIMANWRDFDRSLTYHGITYRTAFYHEHAHQLLQKVFYEDNEYAAFPCCYAKTIMPVDLFIYEYRIGDVAQSVSVTSRINRVGHTLAVFRRMVEKYRQISESSGKDYVAMKIYGVLVSYLVTTLIDFDEKKKGRQLSSQVMQECMDNAPEIYAMTQKKHRAMYLLNLLHFKRDLWDSFMNSKLYRLLRKDHMFD